MKSIVWKIFSLFSPYVDPFERKAEKFFQWMRSNRTGSAVHRRLEQLMQENTLILNIWLEKRFKNYRYLSKSTRRTLYENAELIEADFDEFYTARPHATPADCVNALMRYFDPRGRYVYRESSSFGKLLANPKKEKLVGDCNQIVTLYAHLFSRYFPIHLLQIKLIPGHVCLHFNGDDIECTNATVQSYEKFDSVSPITELISTNLLDVNDPDEATQQIEPEVFVKGAQLALALSSKRSLVENNVRVAYHNLAVTAIKKKDFVRAYFYSEKTGEAELMQSCYSAEFNSLIATISHVKTIKEAKPHKSTYKKLRDLARKMRDSTREKQIEATLKQL